jgi:hypothetical protein
MTEQFAPLARVVLAVAVAAFLVLLGLRRLLPAGRRHRGRAARIFFGIAVVLAALAIGIGGMGVASPGVLLYILALVALLAGLIGLGGLALQLDRTLGHGDWIKVHDDVGRIVEIGWRSTRILTKDGDTVFVPNGEIVTGRVLNFSPPTGVHRVSVRVGFHQRHPPEEVRDALLEAVRDAPGVLEAPPPDCIMTDFADTANVYAARYWIGDFAHDVTIDSEVRSRIWYAARRAGLEMPYPIRTVLLPPPSEAEKDSADAETAARAMLLGRRVLSPRSGHVADRPRSEARDRRTAVGGAGDTAGVARRRARGAVGGRPSPAGEPDAVAAAGRIQQFFRER